jgi:hypothetical protein
MKRVINDAEVEVDDRHAKTRLLWVLRDVVGLHGTKFGCGAGFCAACTVLIDSKNTKSCQTATRSIRLRTSSKYGENTWAAVRGYLDAITAAATPVIEKYTGVLAAADVFTASTTFHVVQSRRLDLGYGSQVHS